ncbi:MAG: septum site-determining protein MinC [Anaerolineae bacterium]|nr:septum site-determining protein MinC [Anaerolineae bacterium]
MDNNSPLFQIKGVKEGLLISLGEGDWPMVQGALLAHIESNTSFFQGARIALDVSNRVFHAAELGLLRDELSERGVSLWAIISNSPTTEETARLLGLATRLSVPKPDRIVKSMDTALGGEEAIFVNRTLRSGFRIEYAGHVVVIGDVNPGAEIVAGGSVMVWGRLRGVVHAGAEGDESAVVCALSLEPTQLRIATLIAVDTKQKGKHHPEIALIKNGRVVAEQWNY